MILRNAIKQEEGHDYNRLGGRKMKRQTGHGRGGYGREAEDRETITSSGSAAKGVERGRTSEKENFLILLFPRMISHIKAQEVLTPATDRSPRRQWSLGSVC